MDQFIGTLEGLDNQTNRNLGIKLTRATGTSSLAGAIAVVTSTFWMMLATFGYGRRAVCRISRGDYGFPDAR
jgi:hypothetical protein